MQHATSLLKLVAPAGRGHEGSDGFLKSVPSFPFLPSGELAVTSPARCHLLFRNTSILLYKIKEGFYIPKFTLRLKITSVANIFNKPYFYILHRKWEMFSFSFSTSEKSQQNNLAKDIRRHIIFASQ